MFAEKHNRLFDVEGGMMLQTELIDINKITDARMAFICARLHLRNAKRRLQRGSSAAGIVALYDAIFFGMRYYIARHQHCASFIKNTDVWDAASLFHALARAGVFDDPLIFNRLSLVVERTLWKGSTGFDASAALAEVEILLQKLGVMPFDKSASRSKPVFTTKID